MIFRLETSEIIALVLTLLLSLSLHEWAHAGAAYIMGDNTAKQQNRLSLNPLNHIDLFGFLAILLVGFGWAKPVQIDIRNFRHPVRGEIFVSLAGPFSNLLLASLLLAGSLRGWFPYTLPLEFLGIPGIPNIPVGPMLDLVIHLNLVLFIFNMLPIPPLDGSHLVTALIPKHMEQTKRSFQRYGQFSLLAILLLSAVFNYRLLPISSLTRQLINFLVPLLSPHS
ncbi:site-2 protease family protein [Candidatus Haliotispira prima]|uniref:Site-2 protease family protein n=1 Tax=Candidatus Haliotispira prima TaxID=3034016 RepID=A0ABY8MFL3_9SPIO|nr:site-2 protease family protein [Candidatus Haliotispira prima]